MIFKAVLFDLGGVLTQPLLEAFGPKVVASGADLGATTLAIGEMFMGEGDTDSPTHQLERGTITLEEFLQTFGDADQAILRSFLHPDSDHYLMSELRSHPEMAQLARDCREAGLATAIVSNTVLEWQQAWDTATPEPEMFDHRVLSCHVGCRKPGPEIFQLALDRLGVGAHEALFLDDSAPMVRGAADMGLTAVEVDDHHRAIAEVRGLLGMSQTDLR